MINGTSRRLRSLVWAACAMALMLGACAQEAAETTADVAANSDQTTAALTQIPQEVSELQRIDITIGNGATAVAGQSIVVHYTGWLFDPAQADNKGTKFDSSVDRNQPFVFGLGAGQVIRGWDEGFDGMQVGGKRLLVIPPEMGYGARGAGGAIPPNATLIFEVDLLEIQ